MDETRRSVTAEHALSGQAQMRRMYGLMVFKDFDGECRFALYASSCLPHES
jgi:hypothetical protein